MSFQIPQSLDIFIIHSEKDDYLIQELVNHFHDSWYGNTKFEIKWLDSKKGDYVGEDFGKRIRNHIKNCAHYLIIITKYSWKSLWVNQEIGFAFRTSMKRCLIMMARGLRKKNIWVHSFKLRCSIFHLWEV